MDISPFDTYLVNGNITIFCGIHTDTFKSDILNSSLYAELVATQRRGDREALWTTYTEIVSKFKWIINSRETQSTAFDNSSLLKLLIQSAGPALPQAEQHIVANAFSRIKNSNAAHWPFIQSSTNSTAAALRLPAQHTRC